jgi:hypothetical protein
LRAEPSSLISLPAPSRAAQQFLRDFFFLRKQFLREHLLQCRPPGLLVISFYFLNPCHPVAWDGIASGEAQLVHPAQAWPPYLEAVFAYTTV